MLEELNRQLAASESLTGEQVALAVEQLIGEGASVAIKAEFLIGLARKGETVEEISAFARELRNRAIQPPVDPQWRNGREVLDVCGTGGDRLNTFNISTAVALVCAAAGVPVAKHGNRAITSQAGSADVLEALGVRIDLPPAEAAQSLKARNFAFFFAPNYHTAFRHIIPARKLCAERGQRTIFNYLGPLLNPARPSVQLVGVPSPGLCEKIARALQALGSRRAMVVSGSVDGDPGVVTAASSGGEIRFLDELSTLGENTVAEFYHERGFAMSMLAPGDFGLQAATLADLKGGDKVENAKVIRNILDGVDRGPRREAVLLNAAAALLVAGRVRTLSDGWTLAAATIDQGFTARKLKELVNE